MGTINETFTVRYGTHIEDPSSNVNMSTSLIAETVDGNTRKIGSDMGSVVVGKIRRSKSILDKAFQLYSDSRFYSIKATTKTVTESVQYAAFANSRSTLPMMDQGRATPILAIRQKRKNVNGITDDKYIIMNTTPKPDKDMMKLSYWIGVVVGEARFGPSAWSFALDLFADLAEVVVNGVKSVFNTFGAEIQYDNFYFGLVASDWSYYHEYPALKGGFDEILKKQAEAQRIYDISAANLEKHTKALIRLSLGQRTWKRIADRSWGNDFLADVGAIIAIVVSMSWETAWNIILNILPIAGHAIAAIYYTAEAAVNLVLLLSWSTIRAIYWLIYHNVEEFGIKMESDGKKRQEAYLQRNKQRYYEKLQMMVDPKCPALKGIKPESLSEDKLKELLFGKLQTDSNGKKYRDGNNSCNVIRYPKQDIDNMSPKEEENYYLQKAYFSSVGLDIDAATSRLGQEYVYVEDVAPDDSVSDHREPEDVAKDHVAQYYMLGVRLEHQIDKYRDDKPNEILAKIVFYTVNELHQGMLSRNKNASNDTISYSYSTVFTYPDLDMYIGFQPITHTKISKKNKHKYSAGIYRIKASGEVIVWCQTDIHTYESYTVKIENRLDVNDGGYIKNGSEYIYDGGNHPKNSIYAHMEDISEPSSGASKAEIERYRASKMETFLPIFKGTIENLDPLDLPIAKELMLHDMKIMQTWRELDWWEEDWFGVLMNIVVLAVSVAISFATAGVGATPAAILGEFLIGLAVGTAISIIGSAIATIVSDNNKRLNKKARANKEKMSKKLESSLKDRIESEITPGEMMDIMRDPESIEGMTIQDSYQFGNNVVKTELPSHRTEFSLKNSYDDKKIK